MRGKAVTHGIITQVYGITPAYAGKSDPYYELIELK